MAGKNSKMCKLAKKGDLKAIVKLGGNPAYVCGKCGRLANDKRNLCKPESF